MHKPFFSIVIPSLNEEKYLPKLLLDLSKQTFDLDNLEVIIVDAHSDDQTVNFAQKFNHKLNLKIVNSQKRNVGHQRNLGAKDTKGKWVIFMDADNRLAKYFLDGIKYQLAKKPQLDAFSCFMTFQPKNRQNIPLAELTNLAMELSLKIKPFAPGALIGVRNKVLSDVKFDPKLILSEDHNFVRDLIKKNYHFAFFKEPKFVCSLRRLQQEGLLRLLRAYATIQLMELTGRPLNKKLKIYPMNGGLNYQKLKTTPFYSNVFKTITQLSKKQIKQVRDILEQNFL